MPGKILIVDDMAVNRAILNAMLQQAYDILQAANGEEALRTLSHSAPSISAVLLDINMPGIDGFEVLRRIRAEAPLSHLPVIMITSNDDEESMRKAMDLGANDYIFKPYSSERIKRSLQKNIRTRGMAPQTEAGGDSPF